MSFGAVIQESFARSFSLYDDLVDVVEESILSSRLGDLPSNTVGLQLWCVVGARENFAKAIAANQWSGFSCSLNTTTNREQVATSLRHSAQAVSDVLETIESYTDPQSELIVGLLEHEAAHHGQLIRYIYGLDLPIPDSWKSKYALEER